MHTWLRKKQIVGSLAALVVLGAVSVSLAGCDKSPNNIAESSEVKNATDVSSYSSAADPSKTIDKDAWNLILVNETHTVDEKLAPDCKALSNGVLVDQRIYDAVNEMIEAAQKENINLYVLSAYRSYDLQTKLFQEEVEENKTAGMEEDAAKATAKTVVAMPGTSEHQTGLALDFGTDGDLTLEESFKNTEAGKWLKNNAWKYGFILRFPEGKEEITGIIFEPWHYRYVGKEAAKSITDQGLCLEEYLTEVESVAEGENTSAQEEIKASDKKLSLEAYGVE